MRPRDEALTGRVALVTGASRGIGRAVCVDLALSGASIAAASRDAEAAGETVRLVGQAGAAALFVPCDVREEAQVAAVVERTVERFGRLDVVVNNAGITRAAGPGEEDGEGWADVIATNLTGPFLVVRHALEHLRRSGHGAVVNVGSILGLVAWRGETAYTAAKGGLHQLTRQLAVALADDGIRVNCVAPGYVRTPMFEEGQTRKEREQIAALHALGRVGEPEEVARAVTFLASDAASFVTGACLAVDGGLTCRYGL